MISPQGRTGRLYTEAAAEGRQRALSAGRSGSGGRPGAAQARAEAEGGGPRGRPGSFSHPTRKEEELRAPPSAWRLGSAGHRFRYKGSRLCAFIPKNRKEAFSERRLDSPAAV